MMIIAILQVQALALFSLLQETKADFDDLGKLLLGGVSVAIVFALAFSFVRLRLREKNPPKSDFITIAANDKE